MNKYFCHETSTIDKPTNIGDNTKIWHYSHIMKNANIGKHCIIGQNVYISDGVIIGNRVKIQNNVSIYKGVTCEDDVFVGPSVVFTNVINPRSFVETSEVDVILFKSEILTLYMLLLLYPYMKFPTILC